jgi:hypothetical protein
MRNISELNINVGGRRVGRVAPSNEVICAFQDHFGIALPEAYLKLLRHSNGGHPELDSIEPIHRSGAAHWSVDHFYYLDDDRTSSQSLWAVMKEWAGICWATASSLSQKMGAAINSFLT